MNTTERAIILKRIKKVEINQLLIFTLLEQIFKFMVILNQKNNLL